MAAVRRYIWKNMDVKKRKVPERGMLRKNFLQMLTAEKKKYQGRNCPTTPFPLKIKWIVSWILVRHCVTREFAGEIARELAHDVHHMRCESKFNIFSCLFQSKARAIYPKSIQKLWKLSENWSKTKKAISQVGHTWIQHQSNNQ